MATTMKDVARRAGVDVSTVSLAINKDPRIRTETRERILGIAQELGYRKNFLARGLRSGRSFTIGAIVSGATPHWSEVLAGAQSVLEKHDYHLLLDFAQHAGQHHTGLQIDALKAKRIDGLLIAPPSGEVCGEICTAEAQEPYLLLRDENIPFVFVDRSLPGLDADIVSASNFEGARAATEALIAQGHRRIAYLYASHRMNTAQLERLSGYNTSMRDSGLVPQPCEAPTGCANRIEEGCAAMAALLMRLPREYVTAAIAATDSTALGALRALDDAGYQVPNDLSLIAIGGSPMMAFLHPPLTTMTLPTHALGVAAAQMLLDRIAGDDAPFQHVRLESELVNRRSCAAPSS